RLPPTPLFPYTPLFRSSPRLLRWEVLCVLALSLGAAAVSATISFIGVLTAPESLSEQSTALIRSRAEGRPWLDLSLQLYVVIFADRKSTRLNCSHVST